VALGVSAGVEYVFPPFPGDTVTLLGAALAGRGHFSIWGALGALTAGSAAGAAADFWLGVLVRRRRERRAAARGPAAPPGRFGAQVDKVVARFRRHGEVYVLLNRFLPGIRAVFFYAAALSGMSFWKVMLYATLSALAWNGLLLAGGAALGLSFERLLELARTYSVVMWVALGVVALGLVGRWLWKRRAAVRRAGAGGGGGDGEGDGDGDAGAGR
jgi:membrane protein DedA with SNARE-associated domain